MSNSNYESLSKEELLALIQQRDKVIAKQEKAALTLKDTINQLKLDKALLASDNKKLKKLNVNLKSIIESIKAYAKDLNVQGCKWFDDHVVEDIKGVKDLGDYILGVLCQLQDTLRQLHTHQEGSLNLSKSEKNGGRFKEVEDSVNGEFEKQAIADGKDILKDEKEATLVDNEDNDADELAELLDDNDIQNTEQELEQQIETASSDHKYKQCDPKEVLAARTDKTIDSTTTALNRCVEPISKHNKNLYQNEGVVQGKNKRYVSLNDSSEIISILEMGDKVTYQRQCPCCGSICSTTSKIERYNSTTVKGNNQGDIKQSISAVYTLTCPECGESFELNPASLTDFKVTSKLPDINTKETPSVQDVEAKVNAQTASISDNLATISRHVEGKETTCRQDVDTKETALSNKNTDYKKANKQRQKERKESFKEIKSSDNIFTREVKLEDLLMDGLNGQKVINPVSFSRIADAYAQLPVFLKSQISTGVAVSATSLFGQIGAPKNRVFNFFQGHGLELTKEQWIATINAICRAFCRNVSKQIQLDILKWCKTVLMDESTLLVREYAAQSKSKTKKSQLWVMSSGWGSPYKAQWFTVTNNRSAQTVIDVFDNPEIQNDKNKLKVEYLTTDGYVGYTKAIKVLKEHGINITSTRCLCHARRPLHRYLKDSGLLKIYNLELLPKGSKFSDFKKNLTTYLKSPTDRELTAKDRDLLIIYYLINSLFVVDSSIVFKHSFDCTTDEFKQDLQEARTNSSRTIVNTLFDAIRVFVANNPNIFDTKLCNGNLKYKPIKFYPEAKALFYLLSYEKELKEFINSPEIELTQSSCERALKLGICSRKAFMFIDSIDGSNAFADLQTIVNTCISNGINVDNYLTWLIANQKYRLSLLEAKGHSDPTFYSMPRKKSTKVENKDENGNTKQVSVSIPMYEQNLCYDKIDVSDLTPYAYLQYLQATFNSK